MQKLMATLFDDLKPKAAHFAPLDGHRAAYIVFDMQDPSSFAPVMDIEDLRKELEKVGA